MICDCVFGVVACVLHLMVNRVLPPLLVNIPVP